MSGAEGRLGPADLAEWVRYLKDIGVRELSVSAAAPASSEVEAPSAEPAPQSVADRAVVRTTFPMLPIGGETPADPVKRLEEIRTRLGDCTRCKLHENRTNIVFGVGSARARLLFVGEGPGADEDIQGEPFVGRAGKKLDEMIVAIGLERKDVYIANVVKCRPPDNRAPQPDEVATCSPFLFEQIAAIRPRVIVTLGAPAAKLLLDTKVGITRLRGIWHSYCGIPLMPTFHPAYLLRAYTPENRRKVWEDLKAARARMDESP